MLIVEDDAHIAELLRMHLRDEGYAVEHAADGHEGMRRLEEGGWDALVLDLMLPGVDGLEICKRARGARPSSSPAPVPARCTASWAWSWAPTTTWPSPSRCWSWWRGYGRCCAARARWRPHGRRHAGAARPGHRSGGAHRAPGRRALDLTPREFDLLHFFARHPDKVYSRLDLLNQVWGYQHEGYEHTVNTHINRLRTKIEDDPSEPRRILTVWGRGYKFAATQDAA